MSRRAAFALALSFVLGALGCTVHTHPVRYVEAPQPTPAAPAAYYEPEAYSAPGHYYAPQPRPAYYEHHYRERRRQHTRTKCYKTHEIGKGLFKIAIRKCREVSR